MPRYKIKISLYKHVLKCYSNMRIAFEASCTTYKFNIFYQHFRAVSTIRTALRKEIAFMRPSLQNTGGDVYESRFYRSRQSRLFAW